MEKANGKIGICLSGGGFRATLFHLGSLKRLNEFGILSQINTFSSVSGGSVLNGQLAKVWTQLSETDGVFDNFDELVSQPIRSVCGADLRTSVVAEWFNPFKAIQKFKLLSKDFSLTDLLAKYYAEQLGLGFSLSELTNEPRFVFCAANLESGVNWVFQSGADGKMGDYRVGFRDNDDTVARAVAASSSFTPLFPPIIIHSDPDSFVGGLDKNLKTEKERMALTDGGIYDNLGIEPLWNLKNPEFQFVLVSDAGQPTHYEDEPSQKLVGRLLRSFNIALGQVGAVRKRWLIQEYLRKSVEGTYWGLISNHDSYQLADSHGFTGSALEKLNRVRTDLDSFSDAEQACLINHGYAIADTAVRKWCPTLVQSNAKFVWPDASYATDQVVTEALAKSHERGVVKDLVNYLMSQLRV